MSECARCPISSSLSHAFGIRVKVAEVDKLKLIGQESDFSAFPSR